MNRGVVALGIGGAIVAGFVLYLVLGSQGDAPTPQSTSHRPAGPRNQDGRRPPRPHSPGHNAAPSDDDDAGSDAGSDRVVSNAVVRDHRTGDHPVSNAPPPTTAPGPQGRKIPSKLTFDISQRLQPLLVECGAKAVPVSARGAKPRVEGTIQIAIKDQQATVTSATLQLRDVTGDFDGIKTCVEQKSLGVATAAGDEADLATYAITLSMRLP